MIKLTQQVYICYLNSVTIFSYSETKIQITFSHSNRIQSTWPESQFRNNLQSLWNKHSDHIQSTRPWVVVTTCQKRWAAGLLLLRSCSAPQLRLSSCSAPQLLSACFWARNKESGGNKPAERKGAGRVTHDVQEWSSSKKPLLYCVNVFTHYVF